MTNVFVAIYTTFADIKNAKRFGKKIIEKRLGACVNIISNVLSIYRWEGSIEEELEILVWLKTRENLVPKVEAMLKDMHSYDTPAFVVYKIHTGSEEYLKWLADETDTSNIN